eukprot:PhF_6_TR36007/c0_g1_i1/m.52173/K07759/PARG; poly(ADP-ribose) glycohydrolase
MTVRLLLLLLPPSRVGHRVKRRHLLKPLVRNQQRLPPTPPPIIQQPQHIPVAVKPPPPPEPSAPPPPPPLVRTHTTVKCKYYEKGHCKDGARCKYSHDDSTPPPPPTWNPNYVRMPFDPANTYYSHGKQRCAWTKITEVIRMPLLTPMNVIQAIRAMSGDNDMDLVGLHHYLEFAMDDGARGELFTKILPWMQRNVLNMPSAFPTPVPLLVSGRPDQSVQLTQHQITSLICAMFFCIMPNRSRLKAYQLHNASQYEILYPTLNMNTLFGQFRGGTSMPLQEHQRAKLDCFFYYLSCRCQHELTKQSDSDIQIVRCFTDKTDLPNWRECKAPLCELEVVEEGVIEEAHGTLQLDFAHKLIGGGVLGHGCVQEEIRFAVCPELLGARVVCEGMSPTEAIIINGAIQYSGYTGYGHGFRWSEPHEDLSPLRHNVKDVCVLAIDATNFNSTNLSPEQQYYPYWCLREINKAYVGFHGSSKSILPQGRPKSKAAISTGNWGCGVFGGNAQLKALIQLCAASAVSRPVRYYTFGNAALAHGLAKIWKKAKDSKLTVGDVFCSVLSFQEASEADQLVRMSSSSIQGMEEDPTDSVSTEDAVAPSPAAALDVFGHLMKEME